MQERYRDRQDYMDRIAAAANDLARAGYVLTRDVPAIVEQAQSQWDHYMKPKVSSVRAEPARLQR